MNKVVKVNDYLKTKNGELHDQVRKSMKAKAKEAKLKAKIPVRPIINT